MINFIASLIIGGIIGWIASRITSIDTRPGIILNIIVGIVGSLLGAWLFSMSFDADLINTNPLNPGFLSVLFLCAFVLLSIFNLFWHSNVTDGLLDLKPWEITSQLQSRTPSAQKPSEVKRTPKPATTINTAQEPRKIEDTPKPAMTINTAQEPRKIEDTPKLAILNAGRQQAIRSQSIFISYRRDDAADIAGRIYDRLVARFGKQDVFKDVDSIPFGVDFRAYLSETVGQCSILLAIIGRQWLVIENPSNQRRLDDPRDFVRIEIESALKRNIRVIPLLVQGAPMPPEEMLPPSLQSLSYRNGIAIRPDPDFHRDMDRLIQGIEAYLKEHS